MDTTDTPQAPQATTQVSALLFAACAMFRATKDIRYYLGGVHIQPNPLGDGAILCATDGHQLVAAFDLDGHTDKAFIVSCSDGLLAAARKAGKAGGTVRVVEGKVCVYDEHGAALFIQPGRPDIEGKFPEFARILPASHELGEAGMHEPMAPALLSRIGAAAKLLKPGKATGAVCHWSYGAHRPMLTRIESVPEFVIATMCMRGAGVDAAMPAGLRGPVDHLKHTASQHAAAGDLAALVDAATGDADAVAEPA